MIGRRYVIVTVGLHATDGVLLLKLIVLDKFRQQVLAPRHLLKAWEQPWLSRDLLNSLKVVPHVFMVSDFGDFYPLFGVGVEYPPDEVFALVR